MYICTCVHVNNRIDRLWLTIHKKSNPSNCGQPCFPKRAHRPQPCFPKRAHRNDMSQRFCDTHTYIPIHIDIYILFLSFAIIFAVLGLIFAGFDNPRENYFRICRLFHTLLRKRTNRTIHAKKQRERQRKRPQAT